jgi:GABA(A) receptor-associated protein
MTNTNSNFMNSIDFEKRRSDAERIIKRYPDRIPVIVELAKDTTLPPLDKSKYLVPKELTVGQFIYVIRTRLKLSPEKAIFLFSNNIIPPSSFIISELYMQHKNVDGFLYFTVAGENVFG